MEVSVAEPKTYEPAPPEPGAPETGEQLYQRFRSGDNSAFEDLVALYEDEMSRFIYGIIRDSYEVEHLVIDTFTQLILNKKGFEGKSTLKTYIFGIAKNLTSQRVRELSKEQHISFDEIAELSISDGETIQNILEKEDARTRLNGAMRELKSEYHAVLTLLYFEDMSYAEAGKAMRKSEKQIKDLAYRAKAALKKKLEQIDEAEKNGQK